jgi:murein L,D-transpeptidase YcbB/YkuD
VIAGLALALLSAIAPVSAGAAPIADSPIRAILSAGARQAYAPLWHVQGQLTPAARAFIGQLQQVEARGLLLADYDGPRFAALATEHDERRLAADDAVARLDVALSATAARLASDLHVGRIAPAEVGYDLDVRGPTLDVAAAVARLATAPDASAALDQLEPPFRHYALLKSALDRYRALARAAGLTQLPPLPRRSVRPGESYSGAPALRRLLVAYGDMIEPSAASSAAVPEFDPELVAAVVRFQARHGLDPDGVLGTSTFRALSTPIDARVRQIELSMERIRWLPPTLESPPIIVNVPQFRLFAFRTTQDYAADILQMDVIVGSAFAGRRTPVFAADMRYVVLHPYWDVPRSILVKELLPEIRADTEWIARNRYEMVLGQGEDAIPQPVNAQSLQALAEGRLRLRQLPGSGNALGEVKFIFPNRHNVYLHDTPERLAAALADSATARINLPRPVRVFIVYGTALTVEAGQTLFFDDIYDQDARLNALLASRRPRARLGPA